MARVASSRVPRVPDLLKPALDQMVRLGGSAANTEMDDAVADAIALDDEARSELHGEGPQTEFAYRMAWVRTWLKNASLLESAARAVWSLTPEGRSQARLPTEDLGRLVQLRLRRLAADRGQTKQPETAAEPDDVEGWQETLLAILVELTPDGFERLCQRLLREAGFVKVEVTGRSGDNGIDGIGVLRMNLVSFQVLFQCKRWKGSVGSSVVRDFRGAMVGRADKGLIITTGTFTRDARNEATRDGAPAIDLVDGSDLCHLLRQYRIGMSVKQVEVVAIEAEALQAI